LKKLQFVTYEEQGDVVLEGQRFVVFVDGESGNITVLFEATVGPQTVFAGDDAKNGGVDSVRMRNEEQMKNMPFSMTF
jgi:hypothetical protein